MTTIRDNGTRIGPSKEYREPQLFPTNSEMLDRIKALEAWRAEWEPVLITLAQSIVAFARSPMGNMVPLPPQVLSLVAQLTGPADSTS